MCNVMHCGSYTGATGTSGGLLGCLIQPTPGSQFYVEDCPSVAATANYIGVNQQAIQTNGAPVQTEGVTYILSKSPSGMHPYQAGDVICTDPDNAGYIIDNTSNPTNPCPYPTVQVGYVWLNDTGSTVNHQVLLARGYNAPNTASPFIFQQTCGSSNATIPCGYSITGLTAAQGTTTLLASGVATGIRRMCAYGYISTAASSGTIAIRAYYNNGTSIGPKQLGQGITVSAVGNDSISTMIPAPSECVIFYHVTGNAIQYDTNFNSVSGTPTYALYITVE